VLVRSSDAGIGHLGGALEPYGTRDGIAIHPGQQSVRASGLTGSGPTPTLRDHTVVIFPSERSVHG